MSHESESIDRQLTEWVAGNPQHNEVRGECCPDFSCCDPSLLAPQAARDAFLAASEGARQEMLMGFLGDLIESTSADAQP